MSELGPESVEELDHQSRAVMFMRAERDEFELQPELIHALDRIPSGWSALSIQHSLVRTGDPVRVRGWSESRDHNPRIRKDMLKAGWAEGMLGKLEQLGLDFRFAPPKTTEEGSIDVPAKAPAVNTVLFKGSGTRGRTRTFQRVLMTELVIEMLPSDVSVSRAVRSLSRLERRRILAEVAEILGPHFRKDQVTVDSRGSLKRTLDNVLRELRDRSNEEPQPPARRSARELP